MITRQVRLTRMRIRRAAPAECRPIRPYYHDAEVHRLCALATQVPPRSQSAGNPG
jgi:hypothetical protein